MYSLEFRTMFWKSERERGGKDTTSVETKGPESVKINKNSLKEMIEKGAPTVVIPVEETRIEEQDRAK